MPKIGAVWQKNYEKDGQESFKHSGTVDIDGVKFYLDLYPKFSDNPKAPSYDVYLKPVQQLQEPTMEMDDIAF